MNITLLDTSIATDNLGDEIIMDAIESTVRGLLPGTGVDRVATHKYMTSVSRQLLKRSELSIVCGTNILESHMWLRPQWKLRPWDVTALNNAVLCGVGWRAYSIKPDPYTNWLLRKVLNKDYIHSVRDRYTAEKLTSLGLNVVNTSCPTLWELTPERCAAVPSKKADTVLTSLTWYIPRPSTDRAILDLLVKKYKEVYFWPQQSEDSDYLASLGVAGIKFLEPSLSAYDEFLETVDTDYVGLRLHGGIRCIQKGRRSLVIPVDNRATEISRDTGLPTIARDDLMGIERWISVPEKIALNLPNEAIAQWKDQFRKQQKIQ